VRGGLNVYSYAVQPTTTIDPKGLEGFKYYGNWCGPNWTGGRWHPYTQNSDSNYYKPPTDIVDKACMNHDTCYYYCRKDFPCSMTDRGACMTACDRSLAEASEGAKLPSGMSWVGKQGLELWMKYNGLPDAGPNENFCPMPPNISIDDFFNSWPH